MGRRRRHRARPTLRDRIVGSFPIPRDFRGALRMTFAESDDVVLRMVTFLVYAWSVAAWSVANDLQVVPEGRDVVMQTSHHGQAIVCSANPGRLEAFVASMVERGFPAHPESNT